MNLRHVSFAAAIFFLCGGPLADAGLVTWTIDPVFSQLTASLPDQSVTLYGGAAVTVQARNQNGLNTSPWTTNIAHIQGTIATDYTDDSSIQFLGGTPNIFALTTANYRPNPAVYAGGTINPDGTASGGTFSDTTTAAGVFGARLNVVVGLPTTAAYVSFYNVVGDLSSAVVPVTAGVFPSNDIFVLGTSLLAVDGVFGVNDSIASITLLAAINTAGPSTIVNVDASHRHLVMPIIIPVNIYVPNLSPNPLTGMVTGQLVANATVPEPSTAMLGGIGSAVVAIAAWQRRRRGRSKTAPDRATI